MKLVTQTAICYWFHANAFDSWWRLALALNGAVSWWVDSFVVIACTLVQTDTDNVNNPVRAADDIYWALIFNLDNKCVMSAVVALRLTFFLSGKDFLSCAELLQESLGLLALLFLTPHTLTAAPPLHLMSFLILDTSLCSNFTLCRKLYSLLKSSSVMPRHDSMHARICLLLPVQYGERGGMRVWTKHAPLPLTSSLPLLVRLLNRCKETWNPPHTSHKSWIGWGV